MHPCPQFPLYTHDDTSRSIGHMVHLEISSCAFCKSEANSIQVDHQLNHFRALGGNSPRLCNCSSRFLSDRWS